MEPDYKVIGPLEERRTPMKAALDLKPDLVLVELVREEITCEMNDNSFQGQGV